MTAAITADTDFRDAMMILNKGAQPRIDPLLIESAIQVRDEITDLLVRLSAADDILGWSQTPDRLPHIWQSLEADSDAYMFALDFMPDSSGTGYRLVRAAAPWSRTDEAANLCPFFREEIAAYLRERAGTAGKYLSLRSPRWIPGAGTANLGLARAAAAADLDVQIGRLDAEWPDAEQIDLAWIDVPYVTGLAGDTRMPPEHVRLANPLWTSLLDEPALLVALYKAYPGSQYYLPAHSDAESGLSIAQWTETDLETSFTRFSPPNEALAAGFYSMFRVFVAKSRVMGIFQIRQASVALPTAGELTRVV